ncbi:glycerate kinase type-2 family protein [Fervidobacterium nodosum]|uniref:glycerate 2-kinase n=1 Tax=Fervidobacterium nodosum (strain ATCC 35602 / DSM 5306 / Rt17-B1) TaxID=381764 RepID=A7HMG7_FERNB|nr:glycerate kinase [Fervidobacterium nodosum]ABS61100.1 Hydroxypyruvate reductase [Fervidobacterium nodosum Rt17-B1]
MREKLKAIINEVINEVLPDKAVKNKLKELNVQSEVILVSIGKAAWRMANAAKEVLGDRIKKGIVITKYKHSEGPIEGIEIYEAGHPTPDENTIKATKRALEITSNLSENDTVLFLVSGGGSALFEMPKDGISLSEMQDLTNQLLKSGANIVEINTIRKHLSKVKGGRFAQHVYPAKVLSLVLSDVLGDRLDTIASGPAYPDSSTSQQAIDVIEKYKLKVSNDILNALKEETPKELPNIETYIIGSVKVSCDKAMEKARELEFNTIILTTQLNCEAKEAGRFLAAIGKEILENNRPIPKPAAVILGGEAVVHVKGNGKGGRNQELALSFAIEIEGLEKIALCSFGTDGTDGPTDAAGGIVDGQTCEKIRKAGYSPEKLLENNDSYNALKIANDLLITGPTGTNVNDLIVMLVE